MPLDANRIRAAHLFVNKCYGGADVAKAAGD